MQNDTDRGTRAVLGIDPGSKSGLAVVSIELKPRLLHYTGWNKNSKNSNNRPSHIISDIHSRFNIVCAVIEEQFLHLNPKTLIVLSRNAGAWEEACLVEGIPIHWLNASTWQKIVLGKGRGKGKQIEKAYMKKAEQETGKALPSDPSAAWHMARIQAVEMSSKNR